MTLKDIWPDRTLEQQQETKYSVKLVLKNNPSMIISQNENQVHFYIVFMWQNDKRSICA